MRKAVVCGVFILLFISVGLALFAGGAAEVIAKAEQIVGKEREKEETGEKDWAERIESRKKRETVENRIAAGGEEGAGTRDKTPIPSLPAAGKEKQKEESPEAGEKPAAPPGQAATFAKNAAGASVCIEIQEMEPYIGLQYSRLLLPWFGLDVEVSLGLSNFDFAATGGAVFDIGFLRLTLNAGIDSFMGFLIQPMIGIELWKLVIVLEASISTMVLDEVGFFDALKPGVGVLFVF